MGEGKGRKGTIVLKDDFFIKVSRSNNSTFIIFLFNKNLKDLICFSKVQSALWKGFMGWCNSFATERRRAVPPMYTCSHCFASSDSRKQTQKINDKLKIIMKASLSSSWAESAHHLVRCASEQHKSSVATRVKDANQLEAQETGAVFPPVQRPGWDTSVQGGESFRDGFLLPGIKLHFHFSSSPTQTESNF